ncbi:endonuclease/exonuclease/phosphatase family protein [Streptomyces sp. NPDC046925]|uniref:endonuclease/exonuclease/phosphatase family protein n=1 Tax=Streptomyces sp. NPDC046925 TaxID=3155375 RepID=UPI0033ED7C27
MRKPGGILWALIALVVAALLSPMTASTAGEQGIGGKAVAAASAGSTHATNDAAGARDSEFKAEPFQNRVVTFNVCNPCRWPDKGSDPAMHIRQIAEQIKTYRPQVVALQEICVGETERLAELLDFRYGLDYNIAHGSVTNRTGRCYPYGKAYGNAILSAAPLTNKVNHIYGQGGSEPRGYVAADTTLNGKTYRILATHLAEAGQSAVRTGQVRELVAEATKYPDVIVLGDFNSQPNGAELAPMWESFRDADPHCTPQSTTNCQMTIGDQGKPNGRKFDYIWQRKGYTQPGVGVHNNYSDHHLVHADIPKPCIPINC